MGILYSYDTLTKTFGKHRVLGRESIMGPVEIIRTDTGIIMGEKDCSYWATPRTMYSESEGKLLREVIKYERKHSL